MFQLIKQILKLCSDARTDESRTSTESARQDEPKLILMGDTSHHLQGADGSYSDNDCLRAYWKS